MKKSITIMFILLCVCFAKISNAQITSRGMAIQGIARDGNNTAIVNQSITLKFTLHYINASNQDVPLSPMQATLTTDNFGVFSYILDISNIEAAIFFNNLLKLKIELTAPTSSQLSDEIINSVPYARSADNGVPTGTIMPFIGTVAPAGWALCNGGALPSTATTLIAMLGTSNAPDLRGMFLRGTGAYNNGTDFVGPNINTYQNGAVGQHLHGLTGTINSGNDGAHTHTTNFWNDDFNGSGAGGNSISQKQTAAGLSWDAAEYDAAKYTRTTSQNGVHYHTVNLTGQNTLNNNGVVETRPKNYGVNFIIKL